MKAVPAPSRIELLEPRVAPAGIISVSVSAGTLFLKSLSGASGDEAILIEQIAPGELTLTPSNGTQLKLGSVLLPANQAQTIDALFGGINIALGEGSDTVIVTNLQIAKALTVDLGNGTNGITLRGNGSYGAVSIKGGSGSDVISMIDDSLTVAGSFTAKLGDGDNKVEALLAKALTLGRDLLISTGRGNDEIASSTDRTVIGGKLSITTGAGSDFAGIVGNTSLGIAGDAKIVSLGGIAAGITVTQSLRGENISVGNVTFAIGPTASSFQELEAFGESLLARGSITATTHGSSSGSHAFNARGGTPPSSAVLGNLTLKGHSLAFVGQIGVLTGNLSVTSGSQLQLISLQGAGSVDDAFRIGGKVTIDTTKAKTTIGQSTIALGRFVPEGPLLIRDGSAAVTVQFTDSRLLGPVTIAMGEGADTVKLDNNNDTFPEATIFFAPLLIKGEGGADTFNFAGTNVNDIVSFRNRVTVDGGTGTDVLNVASQATFSSAFPLVQINIP